MRIACDIDGVLNDLTPKTLDMYNSYTGKNIQMSDITTYDFYECLPKEDADGIIELFKEQALWNSLEPLADSQWGVQTLVDSGHKVIIATATHESNFAFKCNWMQKYFPMINTDDIVRIYDKSLLNIDVMIDDCLSQLTKSVCERICLDYQYNRNSIKDMAYDIHRCHSWLEIIKSIESIERKMTEWKM